MKELVEGQSENGSDLVFHEGAEVEVVGKRSSAFWLEKDGVTSAPNPAVKESSNTAAIEVEVDGVVLTWLLVLKSSFIADVAKGKELRTLFEVVEGVGVLLLEGMRSTSDWSNTDNSFENDTDVIEGGFSLLGAAVSRSKPRSKPVPSPLPPLL